MTSYEFEKAAKKVAKNVATNNTKKGLSYGEAYHMYGFDFAEEGNY